jgi:hypothetical protein
MAQRDSVVVGDQWPDFFGGMVVTECRPDSLHVRAAQIFPVICVIVGFTALGLLVQRVAQLMPERNVLDALFSGGTVNKVLFAIAVAGIIFGGVRLGLTYTFDGASRTFIIHRFLIAVSTRHADQFDSVDLSVTHEGPTELLTLSLTRPNGKKAVVLCQTNSRDGVPLAAAAPKIAALLQLPIIRHGTTHQSDESTQVALDAVQSEAHAGDGRDLLINCPSCHAQNANAVAYDAREKAWGIAVHTTTWVKCLTCNTKLFSKRNADELK